MCEPASCQEALDKAMQGAEVRSKLRQTPTTVTANRLASRVNQTVREYLLHTHGCAAGIAKALALPELAEDPRAGKLVADKKCYLCDEGLDSRKRHTDMYLCGCCFHSSCCCCYCSYFCCSCFCWYTCCPCSCYCYCLT